MYLRVLSGLTLGFLGIVFTVMASTAPQTLALDMKNLPTQLIHANCIETPFAEQTGLKRI